MTAVLSVAVGSGSNCSTTFTQLTPEPFGGAAGVAVGTAEQHGKRIFNQSLGSGHSSVPLCFQRTAFRRVWPGGRWVSILDHISADWFEGTESCRRDFEFGFAPYPFPVDFFGDLFGVALYRQHKIADIFLEYHFDL